MQCHALPWIIDHLVFFLETAAGSFKSNTNPSDTRRTRYCTLPGNKEFLRAMDGATQEGGEEEVTAMPTPPISRGREKCAYSSQTNIFSSLAKLTTLNEAGLLGVVTLLVGGEDSHEEVDAKADLRCRDFEV